MFLPSLATRAPLASYPCLFDQSTRNRRELPKIAISKMSTYVGHYGFIGTPVTVLHSALADELSRLGTDGIS